MSDVVAVSTMVCPSVSEGRCGVVVGKNSGSSCRRIAFSRATVVVSSGATELPLCEGDQSVGVPCRCSLEVGEGVRCGDVRHAGPRWRDSSRLVVSKRGSTRG